MNLWKPMIERLGALRETFSPTCRPVTQLISRSLDGPVPAAKRVGMQVHLFLCAWCRRYRRQLYFLRRAMLELPSRPEAPPGPTLPPESRQRIKAIVRAASRDPDPGA